MDQGSKTSLRLSSKANKLIARDIAESLGKLPPQAIDLEEAVIGALMLESKAFTEVEYLRPEHFYKDAHAEIFTAMMQLREAHEPIDMRTVVYQLRKTGKIELVGGAHSVLELTSKVSSAANINNHATVVVEMAMKRNIIQIASKIHQFAYEDTSDVFELLEQAQEDLLHLKDKSTTRSGPDRIKMLWEKTMITSKPADQDTFVWIDKCPVCTEGNHSLLVGKKKSRKTLFLTWEVNEFLKRKYSTSDEVLIFDTEQGQSHVWKVRQRIKKLTGQDVPIFYMRGMSPADRRDFIRDTVAYWQHHRKVKPKLVIIDGIRDLMSNINDADESTELIVWLEKMMLDHNVHVINVLHLNKTDSNPRGHIGTELMNKAQVTIELEKDDKTGVTIVKCESARDEDFEKFSFTHGPDGLPLMVDNPVGGRVINADDKIKRLSAIFEDGDMKFTELVKSVAEYFQVGKNKACHMIREFQLQGIVLKNGPDKSPKTVYKLLQSVPVDESMRRPKQAPLFNENAQDQIDQFGHPFGPSDPPPEPPAPPPSPDDELLL